MPFVIYRDIVEVNIFFLGKQSLVCGNDMQDLYLFKFDFQIRY